MKKKQIILKSLAARKPKDLNRIAKNKVTYTWVEGQRLYYVYQILSPSTSWKLCLLCVFFLDILYM